MPEYKRFAIKLDHYTEVVSVINSTMARGYILDSFDCTNEEYLLVFVLTD